MGISPEFGYFRLGTEQGGNIGLWHFAIGLQAERVRDAVRRSAGRKRDESAESRLDVDAHFLLVAVRNGLRFADQLNSHVVDSRLDTALMDFARRFPQAKNLRDVLTHIDEYVRNEGRLQSKGKVPLGSSSWRTTVDGDVVLVFGPFALPLLATATAAGEVMALAEDVWLQGLRDNVEKVD